MTSKGKKSSDGTYWKSDESAWDFCGCLGRDSSPGYKKGKTLYTNEKEISHHWTQEEDFKLTKLAKMYNCEWETIAEKFKDKTPGQVRRRWERKLNPELRKLDWTEQEDILLRQLVLQYGYEWNLLTEHFKGRNSDSLNKRFNSVIITKLTQREILILRDLISQKNETITSMDIGSSINDSNLSALHRRVEDLQGVMKETMEQIEKLESEMCDSNSLLD